MNILFIIHKVNLVAYCFASYRLQNIDAIPFSKINICQDNAIVQN